MSPQQSSANDTQQSGLVLGVLEDLPGHYSGEPDFRAVRVLFRKVGGEWRAFPTKTENQQSLKSLTKSYPGEVNWTIAFDGKYVGHLTSRVPDNFAWYSEIGLEKITSPGRVPTVGKKSEKFSGWDGGSVYRPLVAISKPNFRDPDDWKPSQPTPVQIGSVREGFRKRFPRASNCKDPEENVPRPWNYRDEDARIDSAYSSASGWRLVELSLHGNACDGLQIGDSPFEGQWFVIDPSGSVRFLGKDMWLVDAGDYDNDGRSEVLFSVSGYNEGGYRLFYSNFTKNADFLFFYH